MLRPNINEKGRKGGRGRGREKVCFLNLYWVDFSNTPKKKRERKPQSLPGKRGRRRKGRKGGRAIDESKQISSSNKIL